MNDALQALEVKVENGGATPQGKVFAKEWNVLVEAVKALDLKEFDEAALHKFLQDNGYITEDNIPTTDLSDVVTLATEQAISGRKNFVGGVEVNGQELVYDAEKKVWQLTGDLIVTGAVTMFGSLSGFTPSTVMDAVLVDGVTIVKDEQGRLTVIGGGSGGSGGLTATEVSLLISNALAPVNDSIATKWTQDDAKISNWDKAYEWGNHALAGYATTSAVSSAISSALTGYATQSWVGDNYLAKSGGVISFNTNSNLTIKTTNGAWSGIKFETPTGGSGYIGVHLNNPVFVPSDLSEIKWILHSGNYSDYALPITGGTVNGNLSLSSTNAARSIRFDTSVGSSWLFVNSGEWYVTNIGWGAEYNLIHSGNIGSYNAGSATKLATPRTIWGQSFDGTGDISGLLTDVDGIRGSTTDGGYIGDRNKGIGATDGGSMIYNYSFAPITFHINGSERMRITSGGNVAIGGTTADAKLHIHGNARIDGEFYINNKTILHLDDSNTWVNYGGANDGLDLRLCGRELIFQYGRGDAFTRAMTITSGGNVAIGGTTADAKLHVHGNTRVDGNIDLYGGLAMGGAYTAIISNNKLYVGSIYHDTVWGGTTHRFIATDGTTVMSIESNGNTTINGNLLATGAITMFSQLSMKNVIDYDGLSLAQLSQIKPARFTWKDERDNRIHAGGIADDVMQVLPEVVHRTSDDKLTMDYSSAAFYIGASLIKPVIDHERRIADLERENKQLKQLRVA